jgi:hypothetical protein
VKDWDMVYVPYCTGDLHAGSDTQRYANAGAGSAGAVQDPAQGFRQHDGGAGLGAAQPRRPAQGAGGGLQRRGLRGHDQLPWLRKLYPRAQVSVLADASQGIVTPDFDTGPPSGAVRGTLHCRPGPAASTRPACPGPHLMHAAAQAHPEVRAGQFTTVLDEVQIGFYGVMRGCFSLDGACASVPIDWYTQMATAMLTDRADTAQLPALRGRRFVPHHPRRPEFYTERSAGQPFKTWLDAMLGATMTGGAGATRLSWVACPAMHDRLHEAPAQPLSGWTSTPRSPPRWPRARPWWRWNPRSSRTACPGRRTWRPRWPSKPKCAAMAPCRPPSR